MKALSIKQPWAYLIMEGIKDIENRTWPTKLRGRFLIHASLGYDKKAEAGLEMEGHTIPLNLPSGCILGSVEIVDCVQHHPSKWKQKDTYGYVLKEPRKLHTPWPYKGQLRFFDVNGEALVKEMSAVVNV